MTAFDVAFKLFTDGYCAEDVLDFLDEVFTEFQNVERDWTESLSTREGEVIV